MPICIFREEAVIDHAESQVAGVTVYKNSHWVQLMQPADKHNVVDIEITPAVLEYWRTRPEKADVIKAYKMWSVDKQAPVLGTPLTAWPRISPAQIANLAQHKIKSVEELAEVQDARLGIFGSDGRALRDDARKWIEAAKNIGPVVATNNALERQLAEVKAELDAMRASAMAAEAAASAKPRKPKKQHVENTETADVPTDITEEEADDLA
jgi:hypothetical protein